jgi:tRNA/rRNA methyltransferase
MRDPRKAASAKDQKREKRASAGEVARISTVLLETLHISGYVNPISVASTEERVRRMVRRLNLTSGDAELWLGMFRQMLWKVKKQ